MGSTRVYPPFLFYLLVFPACTVFMALLSQEHYVPMLVSFGIVYYLITIGLYLATFCGNAAIVFVNDEQSAISSLQCRAVIYPLVSYFAATLLLYAAQTLTAISGRALSDCLDGYPTTSMKGPTPCQAAGEIPAWIVPCFIVGAILTLVGAVATTILPFHMRKIDRALIQ